MTGALLEVERFDGYWGGKQPRAKETERAIARDPARLASLLAGQVGAIDAAPIPDFRSPRAWAWASRRAPGVASTR